MKHPLLILYINRENNSHRHFIQTGPSEHRETGGYPLYTLRELSTQQLTESRPYKKGFFWTLTNFPTFF